MCLSGSDAGTVPIKDQSVFLVSSGTAEAGVSIPWSKVTMRLETHIYCMLSLLCVGPCRLKLPAATEL